MPTVMNVASVRFSHVAREWRCRFSGNAEALAKLEATIESDALAELQAIPGVEKVQRIVCGSCHDFKIVTQLSAGAFGAWEGNAFAPEASFMAKIGEIEGVTNVETQTYTLETVGTEVDVSGEKKESGRRAAKFVAQKIKEVVAQKGSARIIVATGASQFEFLESLVKESVPWDKVTAFHLDEYVGMDETHKASFRGYLQVRWRKVLIHPLPPRCLQTKSPCILMKQRPLSPINSY